MIKLKEILTEAEVSRELWYHINHNISLEECVFRYGSPKYFTLINEARLLQCEQNIDFDNQTSDKQVASRAKSLYNDYLQGASVDDLFEAKKKKKDPPIGKPKRGGSKAYYVYVRDPRTKRIKKVSFGSGGLRAKINNPKARNAFAKRHRCITATDKTTARYWSCRLPRYAKQLGIAASNPGGFW